MTSLQVCQDCGATKPDKGECPRCGPDQRRQVYDSTRWRKLRGHIVARDDGICWRCGHPGATQAGHKIPFTSPLDPNAWDESNLGAEHSSCNAADANVRRAGSRPLPPPSQATPPPPPRQATTWMLIK